MMQKVLQPLGLILFVGLLLSFSPKIREKKIVGTWKVVSITKKDGTEKTGKKIVTIFKDHTMISIKDNGHEREGFWVFNKETNELKISDDKKEKWEEFIVISVTKKEFIIKDNRNTYKMVRYEEK